jgi:HPt (histidine-containing phosphotransfer) domain-containing protein
LQNNSYKSIKYALEKRTATIVKPAEDAVQAYESDKYFPVSLGNIGRSDMPPLGSPLDMSAIKASYMVSLKENLSTLEGLQSEVEFGFAEPRTFEELRRLAHVHAGNAATFGFSALGEAARAMDVHLSDAEKAPDLLPSSLRLGGRSFKLPAKVTRSSNPDRVQPAVSSAASG